MLVCIFKGIVVFNLKFWRKLLWMIVLEGIGLKCLYNDLVFYWGGILKN